MLNGSIVELVSKGQLDEDLTDKTNKSSIFNFDKSIPFFSGKYIFIYN
jgi:hypothetical protein